MTITTKENANGRISAYYVDGVKVRKNEIDGIINNRRDEIIYVDYYTGQEFKMLTRSFNRQLKVVFTGYSETIMTQAAADELGYNVIRKWTGTYSNACLVEKKNEEIIAKNHEGAKVTVESARANGLTFEEFMAANAGLSVEEYRAKKETERIENARKEEENATAYALQSKIDSLKFDIRFYDEKSRRATWHLYKAVIENDKDNAEFIARDIAEFENIIAETKSQLAELEPVKEVIAETDGSEDDADEEFTANVLPADDGEDDDELVDPPVETINSKNALATENNTAEEKTAITTKIAANGNVNFFLKGNRVSEKIACDFASENHLPLYWAQIHGYNDSFVEKCFASSITAYKWLCRMGAESRNYADGSWKITRTNDGTVEYIYEETNDKQTVTDAQLKDFIDALDAKEHIESMYRCAQNAFKFYCNHYGLTESQAQEIYIAVRADDADNKAVNAMIENFQKINSIETDGSEDEPDDNNDVFNYLPSLDTLNDVDETTVAQVKVDDTQPQDELKIKLDRLYRYKALLTKAEFEHMEEKLTAAIAQRAESQKTAVETPLTKEQIEKLMGAIVQEREEFYDALEEAESDEEIAQSHIDYLKGEIERLGNEYYELWAQLDKLTVAEKNVADETVEPETTENAVKEICERVRNVRKRGINHVVTSKGRHMWYEHGSLTSKDIIAIILAKEGFTIEEYIAAEKTAEDYWWNVELPRMVVISNQATFLEDKHWREVKTYDEELTANVMPPEIDDSEDELIDPPDKADIHDSLSRAMKIALLKVQDFCREKNLKAAQNELSLYNICANAMRQEVTI